MFISKVAFNRLLRLMPLTPTKYALIGAGKGVNLNNAAPTTGIRLMITLNGRVNAHRSKPPFLYLAGHMMINDTTAPSIHTILMVNMFNHCGHTQHQNMSSNGIGIDNP